MRAEGPLQLLSPSWASSSFTRESLNQLRRRGQEPRDHDSHHDLGAVPEEAPIYIPRSGGHGRHRPCDSEHHKDNRAPASPILQPVESPAHERPSRTYRDCGLWPIKLSSICDACGPRHGERARHYKLNRANYDQIRGNQEKQSSDYRHTGRTFHRNESIAVRDKPAG